MDRIRTTHVGSLIRPRELQQILSARELGEGFDEQRYAEVLAASAAEIVRRQVDVGIDVVSDGEVGKPSWIAYLYERLSGIEARTVELEGTRILPPSRDRQRFPEFYAEHDLRLARETFEAMGRWDASESEGPTTGKIWVCTGPVTYDSSAIQRDIANLRQAIEGADISDAFLPVVAPASVYWLENEYYASDEEFVFAVADALHEEYKAIVDAGFLVQIDDAVLVHEADSMLSEGKTMDDWRRWAELRIEATNHALRGLPEERIRYHVCWGSWHGPHVFDPPLEDVVDLVLRVRSRHYLIEQANPRHEHEWRVFEQTKLPDGKVLVPGVVTHHTVVVEHPELVAERLVRLAGIVGRENLMAGTDCGFAQGTFVQRVHPSVQWAKLEALAEGARIASRRLWGSAALA